MPVIDGVYVPDDPDVLEILADAQRKPCPSRAGAEFGFDGGYSIKKPKRVSDGLGIFRCRGCGKEFQARYSYQKFHSHECYGQWLAKGNAPSHRLTNNYNCRDCGTAFVAPMGGPRERCCPDCKSERRKEANQRYNRSASGVAAKRKYSESEHGKAQNRISKKNYDERNKELRKQRDAQYGKSEKRKQSQKEYDDKRKEYRKSEQYRRIDKEHCKRYYAKNSEKVKERVRSYTAKNRQTVRARNKARRERYKAIVAQHFGWPQWLSAKEVAVLNVLSAVGVPVSNRELNVAIGVSGRCGIMFHRLLDSDLVAMIGKKFTLGFSALTILEERAREQEQSGSRQQDSADRGDNGRATAAG